MINKTFRLFISSTFSDFLTERTILNEEVFPVIDDYCQSQGYNFQLIDLRWGVNNESALNQNTLEICLDEVRRCRMLSPKPNFLMMTGERYGWIPLPATISRKEFEELVVFASDEECTILKKWYILDENEIDGEYYLKARKDKFVIDNVWSEEEAKLLNALISCASKNPGFSSETRKKLTSSATEQEILEGLLSSDMSDNSIAIFRSGYPEKDPDQSRIDNLKDRIREKMSEDGCTDSIYELEWNDTYPANFRETVISCLKMNISKEIERLEGLAAKSDIKDSLLQQYIQDNIIIDRKKEFAVLEDYENGDVNTPLFVIGDSGSGKSTLLARYVTSRPADVFSLFYGLDENSYMLVEGLSKLADRIKQTYDISYGTDINASNITEGLYDLINNIPQDKKVIIVVDGLDMFHDISDIHEEVFPSLLPPNVKIIVSVANGEVADRFSGRGSNTLTIGRFSEKDSRDILASFLNQRNRQISNPDQMDVISTSIKDGATPLQLRLLTEICSKWRSNDPDNDLSCSVDEIALKHLTDMYEKFGHDRELVLYSLALIASSPYGVTEEELQMLLLQFPKVKEHFVSEDRYNHDLTKLPFVIWSRLYFDLKGCLTIVRSYGFITVKFAHNIFGKVFTGAFQDYCFEARSLLETHFWGQPSFNDSSKPNIRKALVLPFLFQRHGRIEKLAQLYNDLAFVDCAVKIGQVDSIISNIRFIFNNISEPADKDYYVTLYNCLQNHRDMLNCYCDGFNLCAAEAGLYDEEVPIAIARDENNTSAVFFPYSYSSRISWYPDGNRYAVFYRAYVYICDSATNTELCRIFIQRQVDKGRAVINDVVWLSYDKIAVGTSGDGVYIYDVGDPIPDFVAHIEGDITASGQIRYSDKYNLLFIQKDNSIRAISTADFKLQYTIPLLVTGKLRFDLYGEELCLKEKKDRISTYNIKNGELRRHIKVKNKQNYYNALMGFFMNYSIHRVSENIWLEYNDMTNSLVLYNTSAHTKSYVHPPFYSNTTELVPGRSKLLIVKSDIILSVDLINNLRVSFYKLNNIKSAAWIIEDSTLSIVTADGFFTVSASDFSSFPPGFSQCLLMPKDIYSSLGRVYKGAYGAWGELIPLLKVGYNDDTVFSYGVIFSELFGSSDALTLEKEFIDTASLVAVSEDGKKAVAFEAKNVVYIYDSSDKLIAVIDKLRLAINNNIMALTFSQDSRYLLLWCNNFVKVFDVDRVKTALSIDLVKRPALSVWFDDSSEFLNIFLSNTKEYKISLKSGRAVGEPLPQKLLDVIDFSTKDHYWGPYVPIPLEEGLKVLPLLDNVKVSKDIQYNMGSLNPHLWFYGKNVYYTFNNWLLWDNGEFYLNGEKDKPFAHDYIDFAESRIVEIVHDASASDSYFREKNDLLSALYEFGEGYLVLVSRLLNSVIIFDIKNMVVASAYKVNGNIIGCTAPADTLIELFIDKKPYKMPIHINLYDN